MHQPASPRKDTNRDAVSSQLISTPKKQLSIWSQRGASTTCGDSAAPTRRSSSSVARIALQKRGTRSRIFLPSPRPHILNQDRSGRSRSLGGISIKNIASRCGLCPSPLPARGLVLAVPAGGSASIPWSRARATVAARADGAPHNATKTSVPRATSLKALEAHTRHVAAQDNHSL